MMKVLTTMYTMRRGGSYDRFRMALEALLERGCEVHCLSLTPIQFGHSHYYNHLVFSPSETGIMAKVAVLFLFPWLTLLIAWRERIDLFLSFGSLYAFTQSISKLLLRKPMVTLIRADTGRGLIKPIEYIGLKFSDRILTVNTSLQSRIMDLIGTGKNGEVKVLPNNVPEIPAPVHNDHYRARLDLGIPEDAKVLVTAGPVTLGKNIHFLIRSLRRIDREDLFLEIFGDAFSKADLRYRDALKDLVKSSGLEKRVIFAGWFKKNELWRRLRAADLFISSSLSEGMPNSTLEALGCGLACFGSRIPGLQDILLYEELMFDPWDDRFLAEKINRFFSDDYYYRFIIHLCEERRKALTFDWKTRLYEMVNEKRLHEFGVKGDAQGMDIRP